MAPAGADHAGRRSLGGGHERGSAEAAEVAPAFTQMFARQHPDRDKYMARLFGLFNEKVVEHWARLPHGRYESIGRPTLFALGETHGYTLDFALREDGRPGVYVAEMKCELEYNGYAYLRLRDRQQLDHHRGEAFRRFLALTHDPHRFEVRVGGKPQIVLGTILIWGAVSREHTDAIERAVGFADILSVEEMLDDLHAHPEATGWADYVATLRRWSGELFDFLAATPAARGPTTPENAPVPGAGVRE